MPYSKPLTIFLNGGGNRFFSFIGVLKGLRAKSLQVGKIIGSSTGGIIAALYAAGKSPEEIESIMLEIDTERFKDRSRKGLRSSMGIYSGNLVLEWMDELLNGMKFADRLTIPLQIVATDIQNYRPVVFTKEHYGETSIALACRASLSIPFLFAPVHVNLRGKDHLLLDGSLMSGLIELGLSRNENDRSLTFKVVSKRDLHHKGIAPGEWKHFLPEIFAFYLHAQEKEYIKGGQWRDNILIHCGSISPSRFSLSLEERKNLINEGYLQTVKYLEYKCGL